MMAATTASAGWWRFAIVGLAGGLLSGLFGVGGGIVMVPLLVLVAGLDQRRAAAASLLAIVPTAAVGATTYALAGNLHLKVAVIVAAGAAAGGWIGARLLRIIPIKTLTLVFGAFMVAIAVFLVVYTPERAAHGLTGPAQIAGLAALGLAMGCASGLFGIGGGVIAVPALMGIFGLSDLTARGTSLAIIIPAALTGTITNLRVPGLVAVRQALTTGIVAMAASWAGSWTAMKLPSRLGNTLFAVLVIASAAQLVIRTVRRRSR
jgi:uncharacterized membrane protein YfcA